MFALAIVSACARRPDSRGKSYGFRCFWKGEERSCFFRLDEHFTPEILRTPLHEISLAIKLLRLGNIGGFLSKAMEPPPVDAVIEAVAILTGM